MRDNIIVQSHILLDHDSLKSETLDELTIKLSSFLKLTSETKQGNGTLKLLYIAECIKETIIIDNSCIYHLPKEVPRNIKTRVYEILLRKSRKVSIIDTDCNTDSELPIKNLFKKFLIEVDLDKKKSFLEESQIPIFYFIFGESEDISSKIIDIENMEVKISKYREDYLSLYLNKCNKASNRIKAHRKVECVRFDKDESLLPHVHFKIKSKSEEYVMNFNDKYFEGCKIWKHGVNKEIPNFIQEIIVEDFKIIEE